MTARTSILAACVFAVIGCAPVHTDTAESTRYSRACAFASGGWVTIDSSNAAAVYSAELTVNTRYVLQCFDETYVAFTTAGSGQDADSSDGTIPSKSWLEFMTTDTVKWVSVRNVNSDSVCRIIECQ